MTALIAASLSITNFRSACAICSRLGAGDRNGRFLFWSGRRVRALGNRALHGLDVIRDPDLALPDDAEQKSLRGSSSGSRQGREVFAVAS